MVTAFLNTLVPMLLGIVAVTCAGLMAMFLAAIVYMLRYGPAEGMAIGTRWRRRAENIERKRKDGIVCSIMWPVFHPESACKWVELKEMSMFWQIRYRAILIGVDLRLWVVVLGALLGHFLT